MHTVDVVILTPIELEYQAIRVYLENLELYPILGRMCEIGTYRGKYQNYRVLIYQTGSTNTKIALAAKDIAEQVNPSFIFTVGIAGGVKDAAIGDIVVATKAYGYESGKITPNGNVSRPKVRHFDEELVELARSVARMPKWFKQAASDVPPKVHFGPIASGDKVIASTDSPIYSFLKKHYNDTLALEMESIGFAEAMYRYRHSIRIMNIRAVSDLLDDKNKSDEADIQLQAATHAAAFAFELLFHLDFDFYNLQLDNRVIVQEVIKQLFPLLNLQQLQAGEYSKPPLNRSIQSIWNYMWRRFRGKLEVEHFATAAPEDLEIILNKSLSRNLKKRRLKTNFELLRTGIQAA